ncbi:DUF6427 family protein [uncultured Winogradskyella sp.]|uniref:DUF6427 family protein n=1 Tax=uncultured Winogradskyella sp. TaxID=395353 RepID=UPI0035146353
MITSIFSKSKPINFIIIGFLITLVFAFANYNQLVTNFASALSGLFKWLLIVFFIFLLNFIISKNKLAQGNSYAIMSFGLLILMFPESTRHSDLLMSNLFIMFALRRMISLHSNLHIKKKFFDAGFWIAFATFFYFWAFLFFALVLVALIYHSQNNIKNLLIPFVGIAAFIILLVAYNIVVHDVYFMPSNFKRFASLDFTPYNSKANILRLTVVLTSYLWTTVYFFNALSDKNKKLRPSYFLIAWASLLALFVAFIAPNKNGSEFIFLFAPFSIILANYLEVISERWFKEVFPVLFIVVPIVSLLL